MAIFVHKLFTLFLLLETTTIITAEYKIVCSYLNFESQFSIENIDSHLCTHIIYVSVSFDYTGNVEVPHQNLEDALVKFIDLKKEKPNLKLLVQLNEAIGPSGLFSDVAENPVKRQTLRTSARNFTVGHGFDGIALNWVFPLDRAVNSSERESFVDVLRELRQEFNEHQLLLIGTFSALTHHARENYNIRDIMKYLDFANLLMWNFDPQNYTAHFAPLYSSTLKSLTYQRQQNVNDSIMYWLEEGAPAEKLLLGLPFFGMSYTLSDPSLNRMGVPFSGPGFPGRQSAGILEYNELCEKLKTENWTLKWDDEQQVPFAYSGDQWIGYENQQSIRLKAQYAKNYNLGGVTVMALNTDDFLGNCGEKYPLLKAANATIHGASDPQCEPFIGLIQQKPLCVKPILERGEDCEIFYFCHNGQMVTFRIF